MKYILLLLLAGCATQSTEPTIFINRRIVMMDTGVIQLCIYQHYVMESDSCYSKPDYSKPGYSTDLKLSKTYETEKNKN
jgi:hypothetical protein